MDPHDVSTGQGWLRRAALALPRALVTAAVLAYHVLERVFGPLLRPVWRWLGSFTTFRRIGGWIGRQPPYGVLAMLAVPFAIIEPAKYLAVIRGATGHLVEGTVLLVVAEILSLLVCERIFHAGYEPLMRIGWFRRLLGWVFGLRDRALGWARSRAAWRLAHEVWQRLRRAIAG